VDRGIAAIMLLNFKKYLTDLKDKQINRFRWIEYSLSSSIMIALIAMLFGMWDCISLVLLMTVNACMCLFGYEHENLNGGRRAQDVDWAPFMFGCFAGLMTWAAIFASLSASPSISGFPGFVWAILISYFILFNTFPLNVRARTVPNADAHLFCADLPAIQATGTVQR
jgi:hypothetical protein